MQQPLPIGVPARSTPSFYITARQPLSPGAVLLAIVSRLRRPLLRPLRSGAHRGTLVSSRQLRLPPVPPTPKPDPHPTTTKTTQTRLTPSSSAIPPTPPCPPAAATTLAPFTPPSWFACLASATRSASSPTPPPATYSTTGWPPSTRQATPRLSTLCPTSSSTPRPSHRWSFDGRPAVSPCSPPKRSSPASSSSASATRPPSQPRSSAPSRCARTPIPPQSRASASVPSPNPIRTLPLTQPHRNE